VELETVNGKFKFGLITTEFNEPVFLHGGALSHVFRANLSHAGSLNSGFLQARRRTLCLRRADLIRYNTMKDFVPLLFKPAEGTTGKGCSGRWGPSCSQVVCRPFRAVPTILCHVPCLNCRPFSLDMPQSHVRLPRTRSARIRRQASSLFHCILSPNLARKHSSAPCICIFQAPAC
jgi:hypothetical protein